MIEVEQVTSLCDNVVEGYQVDPFVLLSANNVDDDNGEFEFEENVESDYKDTWSE